MRIIAVVNQKGGCGKTTTAINLSACLAFLKKRVLLIDLDPQGHATCGLGIKAEFLERTTYDLFQTNSAQTDDLILPITDQLSIIPTHNILSRAELKFSGQTEDAFDHLKRRIGEMTTTFDYVIVDSPPNLGRLTYNALEASQEVIIPIEPSFFSLHGLAKIFETINAQNQKRSQLLRIHALMTRFEKHLRLSREVQEEVKKHFHNQTFHHVIRENVRLREAAAAGKSIVDFDREALGFKDYMGLAIEVIERGLLLVDVEEETEASATAATKEENSEWKDSSTYAAAPTQKETTNQEQSLEEKQALEEAKVILTRAAKEATREQTQRSFAPREVLGGVLFSYVDPEARSVMIAGDFNRWVTESMTLIDEKQGLWQKVIPVSQDGCHYKFLVDNVWRTDSLNQVTEPNPYGGFDSVIGRSGSVQIHETGEEARTGTS